MLHFNVMKNIYIIILILLIIVSSVSAQIKTNVLVLGTIHQLHESDTNYTYHDIAKILDNFKPDVVCVEIREQEFRKEIYLPEMTLAVIYGVSKGLKTYPIDWWEGTEKRNSRTERDSLIKLKKYKKLMKEELKLKKENKIILEFEGKNGKDFNKLFQKSYQFINGEEYSNYIREGYKISQQIYGDSPMNLVWRPRNNNMYKNVEKVISENREKNIIILTGSEHKYYFDDTLRTRKDIKLVTINDLLPLTEDSNNSAVIDYILKGEDSLYFLPGYLTNSDQYFSNKLIPLVHGMQMDEKPEIIPEKNKNQAKIILAKWSKNSPQSFKFLFEQGWYYFITKDYTRVINLFEKLDNTLDSMNIKKQTVGNEDNYWFINTMINRTLGFCYDLTGMREKAIVQYKKGIEKIENDTELPKMKKIILKKYLYSNYLKEPYEGW